MKDETANRLADALERLTGTMTRRELEAERREYEAAARRAPRGRQVEPHRLDFGVFARAVPGLAANFSRKIPPQFWSLDGEAATVACPCGANPATTIGIPHFCEGEECPRCYLYDGQVVRVAFSPVNDAPDPQTPAAA